MRSIVCAREVVEMLASSDETENLEGWEAEFDDWEDIELRV
jgi:hypothetical protein